MSEQPSATSGFSGLDTIVVLLQPLPRSQQLDLLRADQRRRWTAGQRIRVEDYLHYLPAAWAQDNDALLELLFAEALLREESGERPTQEEYARRFPRLAEPLARQFAAHQAIPLPVAPVDGSHPDPATVVQARGEGSPPPKLEMAAGEVDFLAAAQRPDELGRLGNYRILKLLGKGGMGIVFLAEDLTLGRPVALKVMRPELALRPEARERFLREARLAATLKHDHVVTVYSVSEDRGVLFQAIELLEGESLEDRLSREGALPVSDVLRLGREIAEALTSAHAKGLIHRDIKPSNLWLEGERRRAKVLDFGLARADKDEMHLTGSGVVLGTPAYMSPEQAGGQPIDARCDLFSLGCVLYRMCTGQKAFTGQSHMGVLAAVMTQQPRPPREVKAEVPAALSELVMRLLAKDREQRPVSAQEVARVLAAIEQELRVEMPQQTPDTGASPAAVQSLGSGRRRWLAGVAVLLVAVGAAVLAALLPGRSGRDGKVASTGGAPSSKPATVPAGPLDNLDAGQIPLAERFDGQPKELVAILGEHRQRPEQVAGDLCFSTDGKVLASAGDTRIYLWDPETMQQRAALEGSQRVALSPDGKRLAVAHSQGARLWDLAGGQPRVGALVVSPHGHAYSLAFAPGDRMLALGQGNGQLTLWNLQGEKPQLFADLTASKTIVGAVAFSSGRRLVAAGAADGSIRLWDLTAARPRERAVLRSVAGPFAFSPDGKLLAVSWSDGTVRLLDLGEAEPKIKAVLKGTKAPIGGPLAFAPDGKTLACGGNGADGLRYISLWDLTQPELRQGMVLEGVLGQASTLAFSPDGKTLAAGGWDGGIRLWSVTAGQLKEKFMPAVKLTTTALSPDGWVLAAGYWDGTVRLWDLSGTAPQEKLALRHGQLPLKRLQFTAGGRGLLSISQEDRLRLWDLTGPEAREQANFPFGERFALAPDGRTLAGRNPSDGSLGLWDLYGETPGMRVKLNGVPPQASLTFTPDGKTLVGCSGKKVSQWHLTKEGLTPGPVLETGSPALFRVAIAPDGEMLACSGMDGSVHLFDISETPPRSRGVLPQRGDRVYGVTFAPDGKSLAAASDQGLILWEIPRGKKMREWQLGNCSDVLYTPDSRHLVGTTTNGMVYILRVAPPPAPANP
jgi:WD40 repeat protein